MPKRAISVTLDAENITWLKGRARGGGARSVSDLLDSIVTAARGAGQGVSRSVIGTIDIAADDPRLERADRQVRALFDASLGYPGRGRETARGKADRPSTRRNGRD